MIGFYVQTHELAALFGAARVTLHALVNDDSGELQRQLLVSYKIWKETKQRIEAQQRSDFIELVRIYNENRERFPELAV